MANIKPMVRLTPNQLRQKHEFVTRYLKAKNAAEGSTVDSNANVHTKNIATLSAEFHKDINIQYNRFNMEQSITELYGPELAEKYINDLENHLIYKHDESASPGMPYCVAISLYPFLEHGLTKLGGQAKSPKHLYSFCGSFINLVFAVSAQFAGACATVEFLMYFDYFAKKDYGDNYLETDSKIIENFLQHVVYCLNQPAAARGFQCVREDTTQLSTPNGFKYLSELKEGDECYVWKDGKIAIEKIKKLNVYDFDGELIQFKGRNYQQTVTPNHRVLYKKPNTGEYSISEARNLVGHSKLSLPIGSTGIEKEDYVFNDEMLQLLVAVLTDGSIDENGRIKIYKSKNRYGYSEIPLWLEKLGIGFTETEIKTNEFGDMVTFNIPSVEANVLTRQLKNTKKEIPHFFKLLSKRQIDLVLDTWAKFDGLYDENHNQLLQCDNDDIRNMLQELAILAGRGSEIFDREMTKFNSNETCTVKYVKLFKRTDKRISEYNSIPYKGNVWCPTTDAGIVIFREENGIPYITGNSVFWNISIFDKFFFESLFGSFMFPDGTKPEFESLNKLQKFFMEWFRKERTKAVLTYPVVTEASLNDKETGLPLDADFAYFCAEQRAKGNSFFSYNDTNAAALASCCRMKNDLDVDFSYSLGAGGVSTGSTSVITININKAIQENVDIDSLIYDVQRYQIAHRKMIESFQEAKMLPVYDAGFIDLKNQYLTLGVLGIPEAAEFKGLKIKNTKEYKDFVVSILNKFYEANRKMTKETGYKFNTEMVPGENLGVKFAQWDKKSGLVVNRDCYNSYVYLPEDCEMSIPDKFELHGKEIVDHLDGGSALHLNLAEIYSTEFYLWLRELAGKTGCNYWTTNTLMGCCNDCEHNEYHVFDICPVCGSTNVSKATRIIGYLRKVSDFSPERQLEHERRFYH